LDKDSLTIKIYSNQKTISPQKNVCAEKKVNMLGILGGGLMVLGGIGLTLADGPSPLLDIAGVSLIVSGGTIMGVNLAKNSLIDEETTGGRLDYQN
jgi:hypothetical protein